MLLITNAGKPFTYINVKSVLPIYFLKIHNYSRVNKWKLFETVALFEDTPQTKKQRSEKQSGIPVESCFTAVRIWKYRAVLTSAGQDVIIHMHSSFFP